MNEMNLPPVSDAYRCRVPLVEEAGGLVCVGLDEMGRDACLVPAAARAWREMRLAAAAEGVDLRLISAFRSIARQAALLAGKLAAGQSLEQALEYSAYPGHSEHHSGRAIDVGTPGGPHLEECFEESAAFDWLQRRAGEFGFSMSYPRGNPQGIAYAPWHWLHHSPS